MPLAIFGAFFTVALIEVGISAVVHRQPATDTPGATHTSSQAPKK